MGYDVDMLLTVIELNPCF